MKNRLLALVALIALTSLVACQGGESPEQAPASSQGQAALATDLVDVATGQILEEDIFSGHAVTMVNYWGTFCPPCIKEMPDLGAMSRDLEGEDFRLIGVVLDVAGPEDAEGTALAQDIISDAQADFTHVYVNEDIQARYGIPQAVPTTIFLNAQGEVIGKAVQGAADQAFYTDIVRDLLAEEGA